MSTSMSEIEQAPVVEHADVPNGAAWAAFLAAAVGSFAMGAFVVLNEAGIYAAPSLYEPAGGVSGRTTFAVLVWLLAWTILHWRWRNRNVASGSVGALAAILVALGVLGTFPPLWRLL